MWQDNILIKNSGDNGQILDKYNKEISNTRVIVSGIVRQARNSEFEKELKNEVENCCYST